MFEIMPFTGRKNEVYDPFRSMDHWMNQFWGDGSSLAAFKTDLKDMGNSYVLEAELPGFRKEDIKIDLDGDTMTISAEHSEEKADKDDKGSYLRRERFFGSYSRTFDTSEVQADKIDAAYENGVLKLTMPKKQGTVPAARRLEIH